MARDATPDTRTADAGRPAWRVAVALGLLILALVFGWMGWQTHQQRSRDTGLTALAALPDRSVWLSVNQELWHLDAQGRPRTRLSAHDIGLPAAPHRLVAVDNRSLYALVPGLPDVAVLDAPLGRLQRRVSLQWPDGDGPGMAGATADDLAVGQDGRLAIVHAATHAVLVFDSQGRFLVRSDPKTLSQPTSLWWDDGELWVADTGQHQLLRLSGSTLAVRQTIQMSAKVTTRHTVRAIHHPRAGIDAHAPVATLIRLEPQGPTGLITYEWADGMEIGQDIGPKGQPRDLAWIGETLLVLENLELRLLRFDVDRHGLGDFGDMTVQAWLEQAFKHRERLRRAQWAWAGAALLCLLLALGVAGSLLRPAITPTASREEDAHHDERALRWLDENPAWQAVQLEHESVRDTIELQGAAGGLWLILSNRRLIAFSIDGQHTLPRGAWHRTDVVDVLLTLPPEKAPGRWRLGPRKPMCGLRIRLNDGTILQGKACSRETAQRMAAVLRLGIPPAVPRA